MQINVYPHIVPVGRDEERDYFIFLLASKGQFQHTRGDYMKAKIHIRREKERKIVKDTLVSDSMTLCWVH